MNYQRLLFVLLLVGGGLTTYVWIADPYESRMAREKEKRKEVSAAIEQKERNDKALAFYRKEKEAREKREHDAYIRDCFAAIRILQTDPISADQRVQCETLYLEYGKP